MRNYKTFFISVAVITAAALLLSGCGSKSTGAKASPKASVSPQHSAAASVASVGSSNSPAPVSASPSGTVSSQPSGSAGTTASISPSQTASLTPSPSPSPSPSPTAPAIGTVVDGWVVGIPSYVPPFPYGTLNHSQSGIEEGSISSVFTLNFKNVTKANVDAYGETLKAAGYSVAAAEFNTSYTLTASLDGDWNNATLVITLNESSGEALYSLDVPV